MSGTRFVIFGKLAARKLRRSQGSRRNGYPFFRNRMAPAISIVSNPGRQLELSMEAVFSLVECGGDS